MPPRASFLPATETVPTEAIVADRAHYAAAGGTRLTDYSTAADLGPNERLAAERDTIRKRARWEMDQNPVARGLARVFANICVGTGPTATIQPLDGDDESARAWTEQTESRLMHWMESCGYLSGETMGQLLHLAIYRQFPDGEHLLVPRLARGGGASQLRLLPVRPDRLDTPIDGSV